jgi:DNA-binding GntR family transcriptional regulator
VEVRRATPEEASFLDIVEGHPVLEVVRLAHDQDDRVMDVALNVLNCYQWRLVYEWDDRGGRQP